MKIPLNDVIIIYEKIIAEINVAEVSIVLFTALDVDALCTLKILSKLMKSESIEYRVYPVSTYTELEQKIQDCRSYQKIKLFFFINCGGLIDLTVKWFSKTCQIFLFDVHKPFHHANLDNPNIQIIDDAHSGFENAPTSQEIDIYQNMDDDLLEEMEERQKGDDSDSEDIIAAKKRKRRYSAQQQHEKIERIRKIKLEITEKVQLYYSEQFFGLPSSYIAYRMIKDLNKTHNDYLWYAIVGVTGNYLEQKVPKENFEAISDLYRSDMSKFNHHVMQEGMQEAKTVYENNSIKRKLDFQFPLLKHWSLYESIMNSPYMISKLCLWEQSGEKRLNELINLIGLSLSQSQQLYKFMLKDSVNKLENQIFTHAENPKFNLLDIAFDSFAKQIDYCVEFTASDYYYAITAILERPMKKMSSVQQLLDHRVDCFWQAYKIFEANQTKMCKVIEEYKRISSIMSKQAKNILERNHIMNGQSFSFVNFPSDTEQRRIFEHPFTLIKLAHMLMSMNKQKRKLKYNKPFIASLQNNENNTSLMVGVMSDPKNNFTSKFNHVVQKLNVEVRIDSFMGNIMLVPKESMVGVIRELGEL